MAFDYQRYLASRAWAIKREQVRHRSGGKCERCLIGKQEAVHHLTYERVGNEDLADLQAICNACHEYLSGKSELDPKSAVPSAVNPNNWATCVSCGKDMYLPMLDPDGRCIRDSICSECDSARFAEEMAARPTPPWLLVNQERFNQMLRQAIRRLDERAGSGRMELHDTREALEASMRVAEQWNESPPECPEELRCALGLCIHHFCGWRDGGVMSDNMTTAAPLHSDVAHADNGADAR